jgi:predicted aconitase
LTLKLDAEERAMLAGELGAVRKLAIEHQVRVGQFFGARDFVRVTQAHVMADSESLGEAGVAWLERLAAQPGRERRVRVPTITDPRGSDFAKAARLKQAPWMVELERRAAAALAKLGLLMTDTCVNYQTVVPAIRGEHVAFGDTGVVIYSNSVCGARSNYEGGPSALSAGLTGRTPRYGFHLDQGRRATLAIQFDSTPKSLDQWGAAGALIGRLAGNYWAVPVIEGLETAPGSDALKHFGAAMASFGSVALFHIPGVTSEAGRYQDVAAANLPRHRIADADLSAFRSMHAGEGTVDVVVFSAPQLSLVEMSALAELCDGRRFKLPLLVCTSPQVKPDAERMGLVERIEAAGGTVLSGMCFYQSYAREMAQANGWKRLATNSAKLVNILGGYGYQPVLASMEDCVRAAVDGKIR